MLQRKIKLIKLSALTAQTVSLSLIFIMMNHSLIIQSAYEYRDVIGLVLIQTIQCMKVTADWIMIKYFLQPTKLSMTIRNQSNFIFHRALVLYSLKLRKNNDEIFMVIIRTAFSFFGPFILITNNDVNVPELILFPLSWIASILL